MSQAWTNILNLKSTIPGPPGTQYLWRSGWVSTNAYDVNDIVQRLGSTYICVQATVANGQDPAVDAGGTYFQLMASIGGIGLKGDPGTSGTRGSIYQPSVANSAALPTLPSAGINVGDMIITGDGNLYQVTSS